MVSQFDVGQRVSSTEVLSKFPDQTARPELRWLSSDSWMILAAPISQHRLLDGNHISVYSLSKTWPSDQGRTSGCSSDLALVVLNFTPNYPHFFFTTNMHTVFLYFSYIYYNLIILLFLIILTIATGYAGSEATGMPIFFHISPNS